MAPSKPGRTCLTCSHSRRGELDRALVLQTSPLAALSRAYGVLQDDPAMVQDPARIAQYLRAKRSWFIVDKNGVVVYARVTDPRGLVPNDEMLEVLSKLK